MKYIGWYFLICCLFPGYQKPDSPFPAEIKLEGKMLSVGDSLGIPLSIQTMNGYLVVCDRNESTCFTIIKPDLSFCYHFGVYGDGPNEWIDPSGTLSMNEKSFSFYDGGKRSFVSYSLDSLLQRKDKASACIKTEVDGSIISHLSMTDSIYLATGLFKNDKRFVVLNGDGQPVVSSGTYDIEKTEGELPFHVKGVAYQSTMTRHPDSYRFAVATRLGGMLELYDFHPDDCSISKVQGGIDLFKPHLSVMDIQETLNFAPDTKTRWGYLFLASDSQYIYALYSGLYQQQGEPFITGNTVHVFN